MAKGTPATVALAPVRAEEARAHDSRPGGARLCHHLRERRPARAWDRGAAGGFGACGRRRGDGADV